MHRSSSYRAYFDSPTINANNIRDDSEGETTEEGKNWNEREIVSFDIYTINFMLSLKSIEMKKCDCI